MRFEAPAATAIRINGSVVPEPATLLAVGLSIAALLSRRRK